MARKEKRRMFSKEITNSSDFLSMPDSCQALYLYLGVNADDDGFFQLHTTMVIADHRPDDLKVLHAKGFVHVFDERVLVLPHWHTNNFIRKDRYAPSPFLTTYADKLELAGYTFRESDKKALKIKSKSGQPNRNQAMVTIGQPSGDQTTTESVTETQPAVIIREPINPDPMLVGLEPKPTNIVELEIIMQPRSPEGQAAFDRLREHLEVQFPARQENI